MCFENKKSNGSDASIIKARRYNAFFCIILFEESTRCAVVGVCASIFLSAISFKMHPQDLAKNEQTKNRKKLRKLSEFE